MRWGKSKRGKNQRGRLWVNETPIFEGIFSTLSVNSFVVTNEVTSVIYTSLHIAGGTHFHAQPGT